MLTAEIFYPVMNNLKKKLSHVYMHNKQNINETVGEE